jgi:hypothetical protein
MNIIEAILLITICEELNEANYKIEDSWFQQYLQALVWGGWIEE